ncbi:unnamed protein product [Closterium sp. NIES-53]
MGVARTSMIHAAASHFLWPFAVRYAAHQLNLWPSVSLPETSPTLRWTGKVGDASMFRVWGSRAFVRDTSADKLSSRAIPCVFLGFPPDVHGWQFYHPTSRRVFPSQDVTFDESVPVYRLFPYRTAPLLPPPPLVLAPDPPLVDPLPPQGPAFSGVSQVDPLPLAEPVEATVDSGAAGGGAARGAASGGSKPAGAEPGGAKLVSAEPKGAETEGAEPGGAESEGTESGGAEPRGAGGPAAGGTGAGGAGDTSPGGAGVTDGAGGTGGAGGAGLGGARTRGTRAAGAGGVGGARAGDPGDGGTGAGGAGARGTGARDPGAGGTGDGDPGAGGTGAGGAGAEDLGDGGAGAGGARAGGTGARDLGAGGTGVGDPGAGGAGAGGTRAGGARAGGTRAGGAGAGGAGAGGDGAGGAGAGGTGAGGPRAGDPGARGAGAGGAGAGGTGAGGTVQRRPFFVPPPPSSLPPPGSVLRQVLSLPSSTGLAPHFLCPPPHQSQPQLQPDSPLLAPSPYAEQTDSLTEHRDPKSRPASPVRVVGTSRHVPHPRPPPVPCTYIMALRLSSLPLRVPLPSPPASSLADGPDPESDLVRAASHTVPCLLATVVTKSSFDSAAASALVAELVDFAAACRLDYVASLVFESESDCPPSVGGECALGMDVLEDRQEDFECLAAALPHLVAMLLAPEGDPDALDIPTPRSYIEAITRPYSSQWQKAMDAEMASWKSTGTYVNAVPPPGANIVDGMWIFRVKRKLGSPPVFKARYVARGFSKRQGVDFFQNFSPTLKMATLRVLLHVTAQRDYELHSLDFSTTFLHGTLHEEIWLRRLPGFTGSFAASAQWSLRRLVYGLRQAPRERHDTLRTTLSTLGFAPSNVDPSLFLRTDTSLPLFYILVYIEDLVFATADSEALALVKSELQKRHTCTDLGEMRNYLGLQITRDRARRTIILTQSHMVHQVLQHFGFRTSGMGLVLGGRGPVDLTGHADASWADDLAMQRSSQGYTFSLCSGSVSWRSTRSSSVLSSSCEAEIYTGAMAA